MASFPRRRVVVTGMGVVSPLGVGVQKNWNALIEGTSGIDRITKFDASAYPTHIAGEIKDLKVEEFLSTKDMRRYDTYLHYAVAAATQAVTDSGITINEANAERVGILIGSGIGGLQSIVDGQKTLDTQGGKRLTPFFILQAICNTASGFLSIKYGAKGPNSCVVTACASGAHAVGDSFRQIQIGSADVMIAGGADAGVCEMAVAGFSAMKALSTRNDAPQKASRPYDKGRDGFVIAEGAAVLVLEEYEHAKKRGATIHAEVSGYGMNGDASHLTAPATSGEGAARCMELALKDSGLSVNDIGYINTHGTSTPAGDVAETAAIKTVFKEKASAVSISSTKSMTGHMLGAAGTAEAIYSIMALKEGQIPPTINLEEPDPVLDLDYTPGKMKEKKLEAVLTNSFGFGGTNACLIFKKESA